MLRVNRAKAGVWDKGKRAGFLFGISIVAVGLVGTRRLNFLSILKWIKTLKILSAFFKCSCGHDKEKNDC